MMKKTILFGSGLISLLSATTIHIPVDYENIQEGIDASVDGDTVLVDEGTYSENLILEKEIVLASHAIYEDHDSEWLDNDNINNTIISGSHSGSCLVIKDGNIAPKIFGFTFQDGTGTNMLTTKCGVTKSDRSGGAVLIYNAYPTINYNRFMNNGIADDTGQNTTNGGAISHFADDDVEFDEDRNHSYGELSYVDFADFDAVRDFILESALDSDESNSSRDIPAEINIQNNYFEGNSSGDGENFYSYGYEGFINVSHSVFEDIDCDSNTVNNFVLKSIEDEADYVQNEISGSCIESNSFYVCANEGNDNNDGTETNPLKTIVHALTLVKDSGTVTTINLNPGVYSPSSNGEHFPIVLPDNVHLIGDESENTILDAEANANKEAAVIIIKEVENVLVANLTLTGGYTEGHGCTGGGGLLLAANDMFNLDTENGTNIASTYPVIENVIIENNHSHNGGGMAFFRVDGPVLNNVIIRNNQATAYGGGVFCYVSTISMTNVTITENENLVDGQGGGIMLAASQGTLDSMTITNNIGVNHGGGIWTNYSGGPEGEGDGWTMTNSTISGNTCLKLGGGINFAWSHSTLINCTISGNTSGWGGGGINGLGSGFTIKESIISDNYSYGGGGGIRTGSELYDGLEPPVIEDCIVTSNESESDGGGILLQDNVDAVITGTSVVNNHAAGYIGGIDVTGTSAIINNVTVSGNTSGNGGGIGISGNSNADITNSIVWDNTGDEVWVYSSSAIVTYSDIQGGYDGVGNINTDPLFIDADADDYGLQIESPCIDAGTADTDGDGDEDIIDYFGTAPDMGAFEFYLAVTGLQYTIENASVILDWDPIVDAEFYKIERSIDAEFTTDVEPSVLQTNTHTDIDLEWDTEYFYRVSAYVSGLWADYSNVLSVTLEYVNIAGTNDIPTVYKVHQNHPNPFNPVTSLRYDLPEDGLVNITVYDMMGRVIKNLVNVHQNAGYKSIQWNATNNAGQPVSAGLYLYTIQASEFMQTKKMILLK